MSKPLNSQLKIKSLKPQLKIESNSLQVSSIGSALAVCASAGINHSLGWAIPHGILGWLYVIYYLIVYGSDIL